jgi:hypothetical protein
MSYRENSPRMPAEMKTHVGVHVQCLKFLQRMFVLSQVSHARKTPLILAEIKAKTLSNALKIY